MQEITSDGEFLAIHDASSTPNGTSNENSTGILGVQTGGLDEPALKNVYLDNDFPITPVAGLHVIRIKSGTQLGRQHLRW